MYHLSSTNAWYNGMKFDSLTKAVEKQQKATSMGCVCDVMRHEDKNWTKVVLHGLDSTGACDRLYR